MPWGRGKILMSGLGKIIKVAKSAGVPYSAEKMYALVNHIEAYPEFLPWCTDAQILEQADNVLLAQMVIAKGPFREKLVTRNTLTPDRQIHMRLVEGPFTQLEGIWVFNPKPGSPAICQVTLDLEFAFPSGFAGSLLSPVFQGIASRFVEAFTDRAKTLYGN